MYHRFPSETKGLQRQCEHIRRYYTVVSMRQIAESYHGGTPLPPNALAVTVDDGYRDFLSHGHPVFQAFDIPATVFLVTDFVDGKLWLWWDAIAYALQVTRRRQCTVPWPDGSLQVLDLAAPADRLAAHHRICMELTELSNHDRLRTIAMLLEAADVSLPAKPPDAYGALSWDDVRSLSARGVEFGAHTKTHAILSRVEDGDELVDEIVSSKRLIESHVSSVDHFCYPNGRAVDFTEKAVACVAGSGFRTAVTTERGINFSGGSPYLLRRVGVDPNDPKPYFEELLAGARAD